jgi:16S rRNA G527 N7-methylase RsmG
VFSEFNQYLNLMMVNDENAPLQRHLEQNDRIFRAISKTVENSVLDLESGSFIY